MTEPWMDYYDMLNESLEAGARKRALLAKLLQWGKLYEEYRITYQATEEARTYSSEE